MVLSLSINYSRVLTSPGPKFGSREEMEDFMNANDYYNIIQEIMPTSMLFYYFRHMYAPHPELKKKLVRIALKKYNEKVEKGRLRSSNGAKGSKHSKGTS